MVFASLVIENLIFMLLFWVGTYLLTIWLMSRLFPTTPVIQPKKRIKSKSPLKKSLAAHGEMSPASINTSCTTEIHLSEMKQIKR